MQFKVLKTNIIHKGKKKVFIQESETKGNLVLDTGFEMYFEDKDYYYYPLARRSVSCQGVNKPRHSL